MRRTLYLVHRWTGIAMCVLMVLWFLSGVVMLFVGYPKLTPVERLSALPPLAADSCCIAPEQALASVANRAAVTGITLTTIGGRPHYQLLEADGRTTQVDAVSGELAAPADARAALAAASMFKPGAPAHYLGQIEEDRWTHSRGLNPHRPLHLVELDDAAATRVYVSSTTGQVVLDAARAERYWNFAGAWLHWLYMLRQQNTDPVWTWTLIGLSAVGVLSAVTGLVNGVWRWRFTARYKSGQRTPYREFVMRWHHMLGLGFGAVLCTWMFSGLMSMNPLGLFDATGARPDTAAMQGGSPVSVRLEQPVAQVLSRLQDESFAPRELAWQVFDGQPVIVARDGANRTRIVSAGAQGLDLAQQWPQARLEAAARRLLPFPVQGVELLTSADAYYYQRGDASMYGGNERRLPALRVVFADPGETWVYVDASTGQVALSLDRRQRLGRWLFNFLHSWDLPQFLTPGWPRNTLLIALSIGGLLLSASAVVIAARRLRRSRQTSAV